MTTRLKRLASIPLFYILVSVIIFRDMFVNGAAMPGFVYDWGYSLYRSNDALNQTLFIWDVSSNGIVSGYKTGAYFNLVNYFVSVVGISAPVFYKVTTVLLLALGGFGTYVLILKITKSSSRFAAFLSGLFYMSSVIFCIRYIAGYYGYLVSGAFFPLLLYAYSSAVASRGAELVRYTLLACLFSLVTFFQIHFALFFVLVVFIDIVYAFIFKVGGYIRIRVSLGILFLYLLLNAFWVIPSYFRASSILSASTLSNMAFLSRLETLPNMMWQTLLLSSHGITNGAMQAVNSDPFRLAVMFGFVIAITLLAYRNQEKRRTFLIYLSVFLVVLPISVGDNPPFQNLYPKLFRTIPGLSMFRESYHLQYIILLFYTVSLGLALDYLFRSFKPKSLVGKTVQYALPVFLVAIFNLPSFTGSFFGYMGFVHPPDGAEQADAVAQTMTRQRLFYPPGMNFWKLSYDTRIGVNYPDELANSFHNDYVNEASSDLDARNPSWKLRNATVNAFMSKDQKFPQLLSYLGSDVAVDRSQLVSHYYESVELQNRREELRIRWIGETVSQKFAAYPLLKKTVVNPYFTFYQLPISTGLVYAATNPATICSYGEVGPSIDAFDYHPDPQLKPYERSACANSLDMGLRDSTAKFDFGSVTNLKHTATLGWSPGYLSFYEGAGFADKIEDFLFTRIPDKFTGTLAVPKGGDPLYLSYYASPRSGDLSIRIGDEKDTAQDLIISTKESQEGWRYLQLDSRLPESMRVLLEALRDKGGDVGLTVSSLNGENAVGGIAFISTGITQTKAAPLPLGISKVSYTRVTPTKYELHIDSATVDPKLIILSENYHPDWQLHAGSEVFKPVLVNTYANAYLIPGTINGDVSIEFTGQKQYRALLYFSLTLFVLLCGSFFWIWKRGCRK